MNDLGKAFTFVFKDPKWFTKFLIGAVFMVLSIFIVGIFILAGYFVQVVQRVMHKEQNPLPEWTDIGVKLVLGLKFCVVYLVYLLPIILLYIPIVLLALLGSLLELGNITDAFVGIYAMLIMLIIIPYSLFLALMLPIISYRFAANESIGEALDLVAVVRSFRENWQNTTIVALIAIGIQSFAGIGIVVFLIGVFFTVLYSYLVSAHMFGTLYLQQAGEGVLEK
jgi:hypothetical protein